MTRDHALLAPSSSERWIKCTASARLEEHFPETEESDYAKQGTLAHELCETHVKDRLKIYTPAEVATHITRIQRHRLYDKAMGVHCYEYSNYIIALYSAYKSIDPDTVIFIEEEIDLTAYIPEGKGHTDIGIHSPKLKKLHIVDFKYGQGIKVSPVDNPQLKIYALGLFYKIGTLTDIDEIELTVYQPRLENIASDIVSFSDFSEWVQNTLMPAAAKAFKGLGDAKPGEHCMFCKIKPTCRANAEYNLQLARYNFLQAELLSKEEIKAILDQGDAFKDWITSIQTYALKEAIKGAKWPDMKLVEGRSNRKYKDDKAVVRRLLDKGYNEDMLYDRSIRGITEMQAMLGKKQFNELLTDLIVKPQGAPTLVSADDPRPEYLLRKDTKDDFADIELPDEDILNML